VPERIQKLISSAGIASRRAAEELIRSGRVHINGECAKLGQRAELDVDIVTVDGKQIKPSERKVYIMLNKPRGYVTTMKDEKGRPTVSDLVSDAGARVYPVGRLDMDSQGLLLMTNDGEIANMLMHPSYGIEKKYIVSVSGEDIDESIRKLKGEIMLDGVSVKAKHVETLGTFSGFTDIAVTIGEGKNRQVRRMCDYAGLSVSQLKRVSEGTLELGDLPAGKWRNLTEKEIEYLQRQLG